MASQHTGPSPAVRATYVNLPSSPLSNRARPFRAHGVPTSFTVVHAQSRIARSKRVRRPRDPRTTSKYIEWPSCGPRPGVRSVPSGPRDRSRRSDSGRRLRGRRAPSVSGETRNSWRARLTHGDFNVGRGAMWATTIRQERPLLCQQRCLELHLVDSTLTRFFAFHSCVDEAGVLRSGRVMLSRPSSLLRPLRRPLDDPPFLEDRLWADELLIPGTRAEEGFSRCRDNCRHVPVPYAGGLFVVRSTYSGIFRGLRPMKTDSASSRPAFAALNNDAANFTSRRGP